MKALRTHAVGGPDTLTLDEVDVPAPGKGEVLVDVKACAINFPDTLMIRDLYQFKPERPYAPGGEIAGVVEAVGEGVDGFKVGDKVMAGIGNGGLAEKVVVPAGRMFPVPDGFPFLVCASRSPGWVASSSSRLSRLTRPEICSMRVPRLSDVFVNSDPQTSTAFLRLVSASR